MIKPILVLLAAGIVLAGMAGCGTVSKSMAGITGYSRTCVAGVSYLQFPSGATVEYTRTGKIKTCAGDGD